MVEPERFESLFSRVICLMPPEELQHLLLADHQGPLSPQNEQQLAKMVREGYDKWQEFDLKYSEHQKQIRSQDAGLACWEDVRQFMLYYGKAKPVEDFYTERFKLEGDDTIALQAASSVLQLSDGSLVACDDLGGLPSYGPGGLTAEQFGLNHPMAKNLLSKYAFENKETGPAFLKWSKESDFFAERTPVVVFGFLRTTIRADGIRGEWLEHASALRLFIMNEGGEPVEMDRKMIRKFFDGIYTATIRSKMPDLPCSVDLLAEHESTLAELLRTPTPEELSERKRHAVASVFVGVVSNE